MRIYGVFGLRDRVALRPKRPETFGSFQDLLSTGPLSGRWDGLELERIGNGSLGVTPYLTASVLVVERSQGEDVVAVLDGYGEWLEGSCEGVSYLIFNPTVVIDAVDAANSSWLYKGGDLSEPLCIMRPAFFAERVTAAVFRCVGEGNTLFLDSEVVDLLVEAGYGRSEFIAIWDSETGIVDNP